MRSRFPGAPSIVVVMVVVMMVATPPSVMMVVVMVVVVVAGKAGLAAQRGAGPLRIIRLERRHGVRNRLEEFSVVCCRREWARLRLRRGLCVADRGQCRRCSEQGSNSLVH